jgi:hypothetical protein
VAAVVVILLVGSCQWWKVVVVVVVLDKSTGRTRVVKRQRLTFFSSAEPQPNEGGKDLPTDNENSWPDVWIECSFGRVVTGGNGITKKRDVPYEDSYHNLLPRFLLVDSSFFFFVLPPVSVLLLLKFVPENKRLSLPTSWC